MQALQIKPFLSPYPGPCAAPSVLISSPSTYPDLTVGPIHCRPFGPIPASFETVTAGRPRCRPSLDFGRVAAGAYEPRLADHRGIFGRNNLAASLCICAGCAKEGLSGFLR